MIIPEKLYRQVCQVMPIACVDLLVTDRSHRVLLVKRKNAPAKGHWWFPGGRVHFSETRAVAAARKLKEECGLEAASLEEVGTYDVILATPADGPLSHGITTLFHVQVKGRQQLTLDDQSAIADWRKLGEWAGEDLHPFVSTGLGWLRRKTVRRPHPA
jgi:ADP-ribose pyrophosphatase YjhB (NUDIX family)